jgi:DNA-binding NarL/FixJ family response regulator
MRRLKVVVADDHGLMVEAVRIALAERPEFQIVGVAESGSQVLPVVERTSPHLVLLDLRMPGMDGLTCLRMLRERKPDVKVVVLSGVDADAIAEEALRAGRAPSSRRASTRRSCPMR